MNLLPLVLSVKRSLFRVDDPHSEQKDNEYKNKRAAILERDNHTCRFCGFRSLKFQEIHHLDDDHSNNDESNLVTSCPLCHMCNHISFAGLNGMGQIIHIDPALGLNQAQLNCLIRELWLGSISDHEDTKIASDARLGRFYQQVVPVIRELGDSKPDRLGDKLMKLSDEEYENRSVALSGFYFLPTKDAFIKQLKYWEESLLSKYNATQWISQSESQLSKWVESEYGIEGNKENIGRFIKTKEINS